MSNAQLLPSADHTTQWFEDDFPGTRVEVLRGVLHTTEGRDWPAYSGGKTAPNLTGKPDMARRRLGWRQHFRVDTSARALRNTSGGVQTNQDGAFQVELVGTCDPATRNAWIQAGKRQDVDFLFWPAAPDWALLELARVVLWFEAEHQVPVRGPEQHSKTWMAYPGSYGTKAGNRLSGRQWDDYRGWCGHQHVPENDHGDPGALNWRRVIEHVTALRTTPTVRKGKPVWLVQVKNDPKVWITDGITRRWVQDPAELRSLNACGVPSKVHPIEKTHLARIPDVQR